MTDKIPPLTPENNDDKLSHYMETSIPMWPIDKLGMISLQVYSKYEFPITSQLTWVA